VAPLILSVGLILGTGVLGVQLTTQANSKAESIHLADRNSMQSTLAGLGKQYVLFSLKEGLDYASTGTWSFQPGDPGDAARLHTFVDHAILLNYGAALVDLSGRPLNVYAAGAVPPPSDPGYLPMIRDLEAKRPDVSSVMEVGHVAVVAMGVPIMQGNVPRAVFVGYVRLDTSALETYVKGLHYGRTGIAYVLDSSGTVVAATDANRIGRPVGEPAAVSFLARGKSGDYVDHHSNDVVSYAPFGIGGWAGATTQGAGEFFGPIRSGNLRVEVAIVALLVIGSVIVTILGYKRESARRRFQEQLAYQAAHDGLTGLDNRAVFHDRLRQALARGRRQGTDVGVLYLDLNRFKPVNDHRGHDVGDALLVEVARRLTHIVRAEDTLARMGGDEFAVVMGDLTGPTVLREVAERIVAEVDRPITIATEEVRVGASVGIAYSYSGQDEVESLLRDADLAMYRAKDVGKSGYCYATEPTMSTVFD
jgi:diguanylate cyclase (GGDEF)-like protein